MLKKKIIVTLIILFFSLLLVQTASAEHAFSIYGGIAFGLDGNIQVTDLTTSPPQSFEQYVEYSYSPEIGFRYTFWGTYIGLAFDISAFFPGSSEDEEFISYEVIPLSLMLMLRWPLFKSENAPRGRLQPYIGIGPSYVTYNFKVNYSAYKSPGQSDGDGDAVTWEDLRAGLNWQISRRHSIFLEFRYTKFDINAGDEHDVLGIKRTIEIQTELENLHALIGYSFSF